MKIKLAILEKDQSYLNRIVTVFNSKYSDNFEIYSFTELDVAMANLDKAKIEVFLASDNFDVDATKLPKRCVLGYLVDSSDVDTYRDHRAIGKFQKIDLIYKQILSLYGELEREMSFSFVGNDKTKVIAFQPVSGGCGASTMAAACALHFASKGRKTLYLNLEKCGSADSFFAGEGQLDMSDIIFALKSKKTNLSIKLESCVKQDPRGVYFFSQSKVALDMLELKAEDIIRLISDLRLTGSYDNIVLDLDFSLSQDYLDILRKVNAIVWVGDGSEISNAKFVRSINALKIIDENADSSIMARLYAIYNKFSSKTGKILDDIGIKTIGGAPRYEHATSAMILGQLAPMGMFDELM